MSNNDEISQENKETGTFWLHEYVSDQIKKKMPANFGSLRWDGSDYFSNDDGVMDGRETRDYLKKLYPEATPEQIFNYLEAVRDRALNHPPYKHARDNKDMELEVRCILAEMEMSGIKVTKEERAEIYKAVEEHYRNQVELYELEEKRKSNPLRDKIKGDSKLAKTAREILGTMEDKKIERTEKKARVAAEGILNNIIESQNDR